MGVLAACLTVLAVPAVRAQSNDATICQSAGIDAERTEHLPSGLLLAIGAVESGRWDPLTHRVAAWPWTINANGVGAAFPSRREAVSAARAQQSRGVASIDVGCFQINLLSHPTAFDTLENAFDPETNAAYAAHFLALLHQRTGSWKEAIAAYHSATTERGAAYRDLVLARWTDPDTATGGHVVLIPRWSPPSDAFGIHIWTPHAYGSAPTIITTGGAAAKLPTVIGP